MEKKIRRMDEELLFVDREGVRTMNQGSVVGDSVSEVPACECAKTTQHIH
jgi:hypothetical protein